MTIEDELDALAQAHGPKALIDAFRRVATVVTKDRQQSRRVYGPLAESFKAAMLIWVAQEAEGVSEAERAAGLEKTLRCAWPQTREWHYLCEGCQDTGWVFRVCATAGDCGRPFRLPGQRSDDYTGRGRCTPGHRYVVPCGCPKGDPNRRALQHTAPAPDDFAQAGKRKPMSRIGR